MSIFQPKINFTPIDPAITIDYVSVAPAPSRALRRAGAGTRSMGGNYLQGEDRLLVGIDSNLELCHNLQCLQDTAVVDVLSQGVVTSYIDADGQPHKTFWDLFVTYDDGLRKLISVKPIVIVETEEFQAHFKRVVAGIEPGVADIVEVATEATLDPIKVDRGMMYNKALVEGCPDGAQAAFEFIDAHAGPVKIATVCEFLRSQSPSPELLHFAVLSGEFWSVVWLLAKRAVVLRSSGYLTMQSEVAAA